MTINQLEYFVTAANCLNFTEAGKKHYISQTAITQQIQNLEEQLNVKLFIRDKRKLSLTPAGKVFLEEARAIIERTKRAIEKTEKAASGDAGNISIGYVKGYENSTFAKSIRDFHNAYPNINYSLQRDAHLDLLMQLERNTIDIAFSICFPQATVEKYATKVLGTQRLYAVLYPTHPFANQTSLKRSDLKDEDFILTKFHDRKNAKNYNIPELFMRSGFLPKTVAISSDPETIQLLVATGMGISIMAEHAVEFVKQVDDLVFIPLEGEDEYLEMIAFWKRDNKNPALSKFIELLNEES